MRVTPFALAALALGVATPAQATDGHFLHGVGAINAAMGGAGVAAPRSLLGTFYLNPAGLMAFPGTRMEFGFELFLPDRTVTSDATAIGFGAGSTGSTSEFTPVPAMGLSTRLANGKVTIGLGALGIGGFGVDYPASTTNPILAPVPNGFGAVYSNYQFLKIAPAVAYAVNDRFWVGGALNVDWASLAVRPFPVAAPAVDPGPDGIPGTADDRAFYSGAANADGTFGWGFQLGFIYRASDRVALGASYASKQSFGDFEFNGVYENPNLPSYNTPRTMTFQLDVPAVLAAGVELKPTDRLVVALDGRYITYESTAGFDESGYNADGSVKGFGWENIFVGALGLDFQAAEKLALRAGYNYSQNPIPDGLSMFNTPAPAVVQHHATVGAGLRLSPTLELSVAYYHAFKNDISGPFVTPGGAIPGTSVTNELSENSIAVQFSVTPR